MEKKKRTERSFEKNGRPTMHVTLGTKPQNKIISPEHVIVLYIGNNNNTEHRFYRTSYCWNMTTK